ncbi:MAG TPA: hypothetical protein VNJ51_06185 [Candidatus Dormibacteraeota bacterium]|nr:hypothetical protein [Candidatus Dormibacteraeota bacterium]
MLLSLNGTLIVQVINFGIFFLILNAVFVAPTRKSRMERYERIRMIEEEAEVLRAETRELRAQTAAFLAATYREADARISRADAEGSRQAGEIIAAAHADAKVKAEEVRRVVEGELAAIKADLSRNVDDLAALMVGRAIGEAR